MAIPVSNDVESLKYLEKKNEHKIDQIICLKKQSEKLIVIAQRIIFEIQEIIDKSITPIQKNLESAKFITAKIEMAIEKIQSLMKELNIFEQHFTEINELIISSVETNPSNFNILVMLDAQIDAMSSKLSDCEIRLNSFKTEIKKNKRSSLIF